MHNQDLSQPATFAPLPDFARKSDDELASIAADRGASPDWREAARDELKARDDDQDHADLQGRI